MKLTSFILLLTMMVLFNQDCLGQTDTLNTVKYRTSKIYQIKTTNGKILIGTILEDNENGILLLTLEKKDKIRIPKYDIESMEEIDQKRILNGGLLKGESIFATRYAVTTNGLAMKKGDAYFHSLYFLLYDVEYAVSDHISIGAVTTFLGSPFLFNVKYATELSSDLHLGAGILAGPLFLFKPIEGGIIIPYTSLTFGDRRNNLTFTAGYPSFTSGNNSTGQLLFSVGAMTGISKSSFFVFDSFIFNASQTSAYFLMPGIRIESPKNSSAWTFHIGAVGDNDGIVPFPIPVITYAHAFK
jgi:hypothetical protein